MSGIWALALKDLRLLLRDRAGLFWVAAWPLAIGLLFGSIMGGAGSRPHGGMAIAVVDEDATAASRAFAARLAKSDALRVTYTTLDSARNQVRRGDRVGYVRLKPGYARTTSFEPTDSTAIEIGMDPSRTAEKAYLEGLLMQASFEALQTRFEQPESLRAMVGDALRDVDSARSLAPGERAKVRRFLGSLDEYLGSVDTATYRRGGRGGFGAPKIATVPLLREENGPRTGFEVSFPVAILWALIGCSAGFAQSLVYERTTGTFLRLRTTPLSRAHILAGKGLACFLGGLGVIAVLLAIGVGALGVRVPNPLGLAAAAVCAALCFTGIMMLISSLGETPRAVSGAGWAILLVMGMAGGAMIPLFAMPPWLAALSHLSPVRWGIFALEGAIWRRFTPAELLTPCAVLIGVGALAFALGVVNSRRAKI